MKEKKRLVHHHNMFGPTCEIASSNCQDDFKIYCHKDHKIRIPDCTDCEHFGGSEMGKGICCIWEDNDESISEEHVVQHNEVYFEFKRVEDPDFYKAMMKMIEDGDLDLCSAWFGLD